MKKYLILLLLLSNQVYAQIKYATTIHPFREIITAVVGERGEVYEILPPGASPHTYELRPSDLRKVETATALFFGSENLDAWALKFENSNRIELTQFVPENLLIYFKDSHKNYKRHDSHNVVTLEGHRHDNGVDPHFWTDPLTIKALLPPLTTKLCELDPDGCESYRKNAAQFSGHLDRLHAKIKQMLEPVQGSAVMISHPFFQYFFKRYGINLTAIIEKNPGKEPTPKEIKQFITGVQKEKVKAIFGHNQLPERAAQLVAEAAGIKVYKLDPIGGIPGRQNYEEILLYNVTILREALQ